MKKIIFSIMFLAFLACNQEEKNFLQGSLWVSDYKTIPSLLLFNENKCIMLRDDFENLDKTLIDTLSRKHEKDGLELSSQNGISKFKLLAITKDSLLLQSTENSNTKPITYYAIERSEQKQPPDLVRDFFINNSFYAKSSISEKKYLYDFITKNKYIITIDSIYFQLEYWRILEFDKEIFFISQLPGFSKAVYHLKRLNDKKAEFNFFHHGNKIFSHFEKIEEAKKTLDENYLENGWFCYLTDTLPGAPVPLPPNRGKEEFIKGMLIELNEDQSYKVKEGFRTKIGVWKFGFKNKYILLNDFNDTKSIMKINTHKIDSNILTLTYRNKYGQPQINDFKRIKKER